MHTLTSSPERIAASDVPALLGLGFDHLRRPIWVFDDVRKRKVYANRAALDLWGASTLDDLLARDFSDQSPAVRTRMKDIAARIENGGAVEERWTFYPNGAPLVVDTTISRIALPGGGHAMLLEGAEVQAEAQQQRAIEALRHTSALVSLYDADGFRIFGNPAALSCYPGAGVRFAEIFAMAARQDFLANMSHELRTPLTSILGFTDLLDASKLDDEQRRRLGRIRDAGVVLLDTLNDVLDFAKLEAGGVNLESRPFALRALLNQAAGMFEAQALSKGLDLTLRIDPACPEWLEGDGQRLRQVLVNFLGNAVKFTGAGSVTLSATYRSGAKAGSARLELAVSDTGVGVPAAMLDTVFERFAQAGPEVSRTFGGTGLGLAISKEIVQLMGGEIGVDSIAGQGARFWCVLDLPVVAAPNHREAESIQESARPLHVLVADDNEANRELIGTLVRAMGHTVDVVADGLAAIEAVSSGGYDLVLMDVQMPRMDGLAATRVIRGLPGAAALTPVIALTANVLPDQIAFYRASGMDDHVGKPISPRELLLKIALWSEGRPDEPMANGAQA